MITCSISTIGPYLLKFHHTQQLITLTISVIEVSFFFVLFVLFDSLCPINTLSVKQGQVFLG